MPSFELFCKWLAIAVSRGPDGKYIFRGRCYRREGQVHTAAAKYWRKHYMQIIPTMELL